MPTYKKCKLCNGGIEAGRDMCPWCRESQTTGLFIPEKPNPTTTADQQAIKSNPSLENTNTTLDNQVAYQALQQLQTQTTNEPSTVTEERQLLRNFRALLAEHEVAEVITAKMESELPLHKRW